jgi:hypothetical protein
MHSPSKTERLWFSHILEARSSSSGGRTPALPGVAQKKRIHSLLVQSETFDQFLQLKFPNLKRYGLEGGESMIPALDKLFSVAARGSYFSILIRLHFCSLQSDISRCAANRTRHASSRPSELVDWPATNVPRLVISQNKGWLRVPRRTGSCGGRDQSFGYDFFYFFFYL